MMRDHYRQNLWIRNSTETSSYIYLAEPYRSWLKMSVNTRNKMDKLISSPPYYQSWLEQLYNEVLKFIEVKSFLPPLLHLAKEIRTVKATIIAAATSQTSRLRDWVKVHKMSKRSILYYSTKKHKKPIH